MIDFIGLLLIGSTWIWGVYAIFDEGNLLGGVRKVCEKTLGTWICKPLFGCPYCQASVHGSAIGLFYFGLSWLILPYVICLCGLNFIIKEYLYP